MTFAAFAISSGSLLLLAALIASWLFRSSSAPLAAQLCVPILIVALACITPYQVNSMLGFPTSQTPPEQAELIAYVPHDQDNRVDLWLRIGATPRAYEATLDDKLKKTLREAQTRMGHGGRVMLVKSKHKGATAVASDPGYEIDDAAFSLPAKD